MSKKLVESKEEEHISDQLGMEFAYCFDRHYNPIQFKEVSVKL